MEADCFDALVRAASRSGSRRGLLGGLAALALSPLTTRAKPQSAACLAIGRRCSQPISAGTGQAKSQRKGKGKPPSCSRCCSRFGAAGVDGKARCTCKGEGVPCANDSQCCGGQCKSGACAGCPGTTEYCSDGCADVQTNNQHCGSCETACPAGQRCVNGLCGCDATSCPLGCCAGTTCKRGDSASACGDNGASCAICQSGDTCADGTCACASGMICTGSGCCASADQVCDGNDQCCTKQTCQAGQCGHPSDGCGGTLDCGTCASSLLCCGDACVANDARNCGACGTTCSDPTPDCKNGACVCNATSCGAGKVCCSDVCVANDAAHCGPACAACDQTQRCNGATCVCDDLACGAGSACCGGSCCPARCINNACTP